MSKTINTKIADLKIKINYKYDFFKEFCSEYISNENDSFDICVKSNDEDIENEHKAVPTADVAVCESLCIYRAIANQLPAFERFVFHGAAIEYNKGAYLFTAPSGTGKTTHINLWKKNLGDKVDIINGDKPIIKVDDISTVYGTPWAGKENLCRNASAPLKAICILKQSKTNEIEKINTTEAINHLMQQVYLPKNADALSKTLSLIGKLIEGTPVYLLGCDISNKAFETAFNTLTKEEN
ncbi:MAG: hypothetical protein Q4B40_01320 [Clostridia bacterium]|nr:hypothetical protein [Clostridia bacterium]